MKAAVLLLALTGCFDSLLSDPCARGFTLEAGRCVAREAGDGGVSTSDGPPQVAVDAPPDTLVDASEDAQPDGPSCTADIQTDPDNCGACGIVCASGACSAGVCLGTIPGQIVAIGHDYSSHHAAMARVLGDAVALGVRHDVGVARWAGAVSETARAGTDAALAEGMTAIGRPWHQVAMPSTPSLAALSPIDVIVVDAQLDDGDALEATGASWSSAIAGFLARGGVVVVLEGGGTRSYRLASGLGLYAIAAPIDCTGDLATITDAADAVTQQVPSPYAAERASVALPGIAGGVIVDAAGTPIVAHLTR